MTFWRQQRSLICFTFLVPFILWGTAVSASQPQGNTLDHFVYIPLVRKPAIVIQDNILPNPSFEEGWYHPQNIPEFQIPNQWAFDYLSDENGDPPSTPIRKTSGSHRKCVSCTGLICHLTSRICSFGMAITPLKCSKDSVRSVLNSAKP